MDNVFKLNEEQKDAYFEVIKKLPDDIYPKNGAQTPIEKLNGGVFQVGILKELLNQVEYKEIFYRIAKDIRSSKDLERTKKELIEFYNNPENEKIWKKKL